jgi:hypothetical protein
MASRSADNPAIRKNTNDWFLAAHFLGALRIRAHPLTYALKQHLLARYDVALDENVTDWKVWSSGAFQALGKLRD